MTSRKYGLSPSIWVVFTRVPLPPTALHFNQLYPIMTLDTEKSDRKHWWDIDLPFWFGLTLCALLLIMLVGAPVIAWRYGYPWGGVILTVLALPAWIYLGPRPMPGFLSGLIAVGGILLLLFLLIIAVIRALTGGAPAG